MRYWSVRECRAAPCPEVQKTPTHLLGCQERGRELHDVILNYEKFWVKEDMFNFTVEPSQQMGENKHLRKKGWE